MQLEAKQTQLDPPKHFLSVTNVAIARSISSKLVVRCSLSALNGKKEQDGKLFSQLLDQLKFYARFEISDETGDPLDDLQMMQVSTSLQL